MRPYEAFRALDKMKDSLSSPLNRKGIVLSDDDNQVVVEVYQQWILLMLDLGYLSPDTLLTQGHRLLANMLAVDVLDLNDAMAECLQAIRLQRFKGFKALCSKISPHLFHLVKKDVGLVIQGDVYSAQRLVQLFSYTSRLSLNDIDLTQQLLDDYLAIEESIKTDFDEKTVQSLNFIVRRWFGSFEPCEIRPGHGPGGIAEKGRCSIEEKYKLLSVDRRLSYALANQAKTFSNYQFERTSKTIFVPKSYKTFRTISMEPATLQYYQQGVWKAIDKQVRASLFRDSSYSFRKNIPNKGYLRERMDFHDQERNKRLAQIGSLQRTYATLDLSAASDSVSYSLVKRVFRGTWLLRYIVATRSTHTLLPDGRKIELRKFAPMGSSLCFPIETILFAAICELVTREHRVAGDYSVFGDDIIVPTACAEATIKRLDELGFKVNLSKSFYHEACWFRESCGGEYCDGFDVTPMRISRKYADRRSDVRIDKYVSLANSAYKKGYRFLRYFFLQKLRREGVVPHFSEEALLSDNYTNHHTKRRWNKNLHRIEVQATKLRTFYPKKSLLLQDEEIRYYHWLSETSDRPLDAEAFESRICHPSMEIAMSWCRKTYEETDQPFIPRRDTEQNCRS